MRRLYKLTGATTVRELATRLGISHSKVVDWRAGRYRPTLMVLERISERLGVPVYELLGQDAETDEHRDLIPGFGFGSAGEGLEVDDSGYPVGQGEFWVPRSSTNRDPNAYATRVMGNSMYPRFWDGDIVEVAPNQEVKSGDTAVVLHQDGRKWIKRIVFLSREKAIRCEPLNPSEHPFKLSAEEVLRLHKVLGVKFQ